MKPVTGPASEALDANTEADFWRELAQIEAESIGWYAIDEGCYLHVGSDAPVIEVVGIATAAMAGANVLWLT